MGYWDLATASQAKRTAIAMKRAVNKRKRGKRTRIRTVNAPTQRW